MPNNERPCGYVGNAADTDIRRPQRASAGQWFQTEAGLHQNWRRDYDPTTGHYLQADALVLVDGPSVFGYPMDDDEQITEWSAGSFGPIARLEHSAVASLTNCAEVCRTLFPTSSQELTPP